jgi:diaminopimelate decarboxylase
MEFAGNDCLVGGASVAELAREYGTPLYVYEEELIRERFRQFRDAIGYRPLRLMYACKANSNLEVMRALIEEGCGIDATSPGEVFFAVEAGCRPADVMLTGSNITDAEMAMVRHYGVMINMDSVRQLERYGEKYPGTEVSLRINPEIGAGGHEHVVTGGPDVKFGIMHDRLPEALGIANLHGLKVVGAHMHIGSNILDHKPFIEAAKVFLESVKLLPDLRFVDLGGGFGVPYGPDQKDADLAAFGKSVTGMFGGLCGEYGRELELVFENGRFYVAQAGHLLVRVVDVKKTRTHVFVGTDSGFTHLIRPALYGAYHGVVNCTRPGTREIEVSVVGNICETGDYFARHRMLPEPLPGDILSIENAGAYSYSMASPYNGRPRPAEVMVSGGKSRIIRSRESYVDLLRGQREIVNIANPWQR